MQELNRTPLMIFSARSGSTPVAQVLGEYFRQNHQIENLLEFFNLKESFIFSDSGIFSGKSNIPGVHSKSFTEAEIYQAPNEAYEEVLKRLEMFQLFKGKYFAKFSPSQLGINHVLELSKSHSFYCMRRRDTEAQILSLIISLVTGKWYLYGGIQVEENSIEVPDTVLLHVQRELAKTAIYQQLVPDKKYIYFEDYLDLGAKDFLASLGLHKPFSLEGFKITDKQNPDDKWPYFKNKISLKNKIQDLIQTFSYKEENG